MATLKELAASLRPKTKKLTLGEQDIEIRGVSSGEIADVCGRFPEFAEFINNARDAGAGDEVGDGGTISPEAAERLASKMDVGKALALGRGAYPAIIACAFGEPGDQETESIAGTIAFEHQQLLVGEILKLSFPAARPLAPAAEQP